MPDALLPVPLSAARLHSRGYNQAWEIAGRLQRQSGVPAHASALRQVRDNLAQATLDRAERLANLHNAFVVAEPGRIAGRHIGVVDDVMTTGTIVIATQLKRAGLIRVTNVVALRTP